MSSYSTDAMRRWRCQPRKVEKPSSPPCQQMDGFESSQPSCSWIGTVGTSNRQQQSPPFWQLGMEGRPRCLRTDEAKDEERKDGSGHATVWVMVLAAEQYTSITHMGDGLVHVAYYYDVLWYVCTVITWQSLSGCVVFCTIPLATRKHWFPPHQQ